MLCFNPPDRIIYKPSPHFLKACFSGCAIVWVSSQALTRSMRFSSINQPYPATVRSLFTQRKCRLIVSSLAIQMA